MTVAQIHQPPLSSVQEGEDEEAAFGQFPRHLEFVKIIKDAQEKAQRTQERAYYEWRGYKSSVFATVPKFKITDLKDRLIQALKGVVNITEEEKLVNIFYKSGCE